jgi:nucleoside-diphosphate kinase
MYEYFRLKQIVTSAKRELDFFFGEQSNLRTTALFNNCTCGVIKPHIINEGNIGRVVDMIIQGGFEISAFEMFNLDKPTAEEFMCVYKVLIFAGRINRLLGSPARV